MIDRKIALAFLLTLMLCSNVCAQQVTPVETDDPLNMDKPFGFASDDSVFIPFIAGNIALDGNLSDPQWQEANSLTLDFVTRPYNNTKPPVKTEVKIFENGTTLYVAFIAHDPNPENISAFLRDRDQVWNDDLVGIKLDTFNTSRLAYQFFINPYGVQADSIQNEMTGKESDSWNAIWDSAGQITDEGYIVEVAIPLRVMNFNEGERSKVWGAEFIRFYPREERLRISNTPWDRDNACSLCQLGDVKGFEKATQGQNLAWVPTVVLGKGQTRDLEQTRNWDSSSVSDIGLDVKWGITPQISLQATINPDFSQVEADDAQVSINNTFSLFFAERRPFFVENADYFSSNQTLVYTRNIGAPDIGAKITGQTGDHTFGVFIADDVNTTFIVPGNLGSSVAQLDEKSINGAVRYRYDYSNDLSVGWVSTFRESDNYTNQVNGLDIKYRLSQRDTVRAQYVSSSTQYPQLLYQSFCDDACVGDEDWSETALRTRNNQKFSGSAWRINYQHDEKDWYARVNHYANDRDFRADLGFETKADFHKSVVGAGYMWWNTNSWWNRIRVNGDWDITHSDNGELLEREVEAYASIRGKWQSFLEIGRVERQRVGLRENPATLQVMGNTDLFTEKSNSVYVETRPNPTLFFNTFVRQGDQIDFANNRLGKQLVIESRLDINVGKHMQLRLKQIYSDLDAADKPLFTARITDIRLTYQFDPRQYIRLISLYRNVHRNNDNYSSDVAELSRSFGAQLLYSYKLNPLTKFFVGIASSGYQEAPVDSLMVSERSAFMKFSYAWLQ